METKTCSKCNKTLASAASLAQHEEKYCRYREGKKAKPLRNKMTDVVNVGDEQAVLRSGDDDAASCIRLLSASVNGRARDYVLTPHDVADVHILLPREEPLVERLIDRFDDFLVRGRMVMSVWFVKRNAATGEVMQRELFGMSSSSATFIHDFHEWYIQHIRAIIKHLDDFVRNGSNWEIDGIEDLRIKLNLFDKLSGQAPFKIPEKLARMKAIVNVDSQECFKYACLSILHYKDVTEHRYRPSKYRPWLDELKFDGIDVSDVHIRHDIPKIEKLNNIKINVHVWEKGELQGCVYNDIKNLSKITINLLLVIGSEGEKHYCGIPSLSRLYFHKKSTHNQQHMCDRCIRSFTTREHLEQHYQWCSRGHLQIEAMPKQSKLTYNAFHKELRPLRVIYADIESYIEQDTHYPAAIASYEVMHPHIHDQNSTKINAWSGEDCIIDFLRYLDITVNKQHKYDNKMTYKPMNLTDQDQHDFEATTHCPRCNILFDTDKHTKVRDHDHITGSFRGALCNTCNLKYRQTRRTLPVIFHNFKCYDAHQIIKHGLGKFKHWEIEVIPQTTEKYMNLTAKIPVDKTKEGRPVYFKVIFLDSYQFMASSLANLVNNLDSLPFTEVLQRDHPNLTNDIIKRKGVFPYSYFDSLTKLQETSLPPRSAFTNDLNGEECSEEDYRFAQRAWQEFDCQNFGDYLMVYLKLDVILLACVFEKFREKTLEQDGLEATHFVSLPGLSFLSAFKMTGESIDLITDLEMYTFFERGIRGGMTFVNKHLVRKETIPYIFHKKLTQHLAYIDQNNLYGSSLSKPLPHSEFSWVEDLSAFTRDFILGLDEEGEWGFTLEVDLGYPEYLHNKTADFPLAPESGDITSDMLTDFMRTFYQTLHPNSKYKTSRKLLLTQYNKEHYIVHYAVLKFYLAMGLTLDKVHRVVKYKQKSWLKEYINYNSEQRALSTNDFDKSFYKLKNNALFGKTMEDVRKRINYKLITDEEKFIKLSNSPFFHDRDLITEDIVGVHMRKNKVTLDKPIFVGQAVLDYSKLEMYNLFYKILPQCPLIKTLRLVGGDTDSFFLTIATDTHITLSDVFNNLAQYIDTSNYPPSHPLYSTVNKAKLGCFKDETAGQELEEMILLRPKMYSMKYKHTDTAIKRAKGISKHIIRNMKHDTYKEAFEEKKTTRVQMTILQSKQHTIRTTTFQKRALSAFEDKRCWLTENESLPHGHMDSPVPMPKRRRVMLPESGDVE